MSTYSKAPWRQNPKPMYMIEDYPIWVTDDKEQEFKFDIEIVTLEDETHHVSVQHCYNAKTLPEDYQIDLEAGIKAKYGMETIIDIDL